MEGVRQVNGTAGKEDDFRIPLLLGQPFEFLCLAARPSRTPVSTRSHISQFLDSSSNSVGAS